MEIKKAFEVNKYFDEYDSIDVQKLIECTSKKTFISCQFKKNSYILKNICISEKEFTAAKLASVFEKNSVFLKDSVNAKKRKQYIYEIFRYMSETSEKNICWVNDKPGLFVADNSLSFISTENFGQFIYNCYAGFLCNNMVYFNETIHQNEILKLNSPEALLLLSLRYCALLMPLNLYGLQISFPYLLILSDHSNNPYFFNTAHSYLKIFNKNVPVIEDINQPFKSLEKLISSRQNNVLLLNGMADSAQFRNENINLLRDSYIKNPAHNICAIMSNTIKDNLDDNEYVEIDLSNAYFPDQLMAINTFNIIDSRFIHCLCFRQTLFELFSVYQQLFSELYNYTSKAFSSLNAQKAAASILAVSNLMTRYISIDNFDELYSQLYELLVKMFSDKSANQNDSYLIKLFKNELERRINTGEIRIFENRKSNSTLSISGNVSPVYTDGSSILIPSEIFENLCSSASPAKSIEIKRMLNQQGYLNYENSLYISKKVIYPPGKSSARVNVYMLSENIIDPLILHKYKNLNLRTLSDICIAHTDENGVIIGKDKDYQPIIWSYEHERMPNSHMLVTGKSGSGKTTFIIQTISQLMYKNEKVVVLDISDSYIDKSELKEISEVYTSLPVNPFYAFANETQEECCSRLAANLTSVFKLSDRNYYELIDILNLLYENDHVNTDDSEQIRKIMSNHKPLIPVLKFAEGFSDYTGSWNDIFSDRKISVLKMNGLKIPYERACEFLLNDLYGYMEKFRSNKVFIVVDEIQNMVKSDTSAVIKILSQGREKNMAMIAATQSFQSVPRKYKSMFLQSGLSVFFQPEVTAVELLAGLIHSSCHISQVSDLLKKLKIAECLVYGSFENANHEIETDKIIYCNTDKNFIDPSDNKIPTNHTDIPEDIVIPNTSVDFNIKFIPDDNYYIPSGTVTI